ncbi:MAG: MscL family protein [Candidatus Nanohaloarchaea archaeon]
MGFLDEFTKFLQEYGVIGLAVAFVIGVTVKDLVSATVDDIIMPVVEVFLPAGEWQNAVWKVAGIEFMTGHFLSVLLDFLIVALLVFLFMKYVMGKEEVGKI